MRPLIIISILSFIFSGCTILVEGYIRNLSGSIISLHGTIIDRWDFDKLPNSVSFYNIPTNSNKIIGKWKVENLLTWQDSIHFQLQIPDSTVLEIAEVSKELILGLHFPRVQLILESKGTIDTLMAGDGSYDYFVSKFKQTRGIFFKRVYYYDIQ